MRFQRSFPACGYVFKVITLVWVNQRNCFENAIVWKRVSQRSLNKLIFAIKNEPSFYTVFLFPLHPFCHPSFNSFVGPMKLFISRFHLALHILFHLHNLDDILKVQNLILALTSFFSQFLSHLIYFIRDDLDLWLSDFVSMSAEHLN